MTTFSRKTYLYALSGAYGKIRREYDTHFEEEGTWERYRRACRLELLIQDRARRELGSNLRTALLIERARV